MKKSIRRSLFHLLVLLNVLQLCLSDAGGGHHQEQISGIVRMIEKCQVEAASCQERSRRRPFITLTFAQSLDGKIAYCSNQNKENINQPGPSSLSSNLPLSGEPSLHMTHALRSIHDAILVGSKTLLVDNPRLSNRLWGQKQPRPVLLDADLKYIKELGSNRRVQNAIVCCSLEACETNESSADLTLLGCKIDASGRLDLADVLKQLSVKFGIRSIMVEGGSRVLSSFASQGFVDCVCITIAPKLLGQEKGLPAIHSLPTLVDLIEGSFTMLGDDCIFVAKWPA